MEISYSKPEAWILCMYQLHAFEADFSRMMQRSQSRSLCGTQHVQERGILMWALKPQVNPVTKFTHRFAHNPTN
jgi:hypothetical protein